jgi:hypothetical protein
VLVVPVQLKAQIRDDGVSVLDGLRMGSTLDGQGHSCLTFEAFLRCRVA